MSKNSTWIIIVLLVGAVAGGMYIQKEYPIFEFGSPDMFSITVGSQVVMSDCASALRALYNGAQPGQCLMTGLNINKVSLINAPQYLYKITSAVDGQAGGCLGSGISPACPLGYRPKCTITVTNDFAQTLPCTTAVSPFGSMSCQGGYCDYSDHTNTPDSCTSGDIICKSDISYVKCLANNKYSGILTCPTSQKCTDSGGCIAGNIVNPTNPTNPNPTTETCSFGTKLNSATGNCDVDTSYLYIGAALVGLVLLLSLTKK